MHLRAPIYLIEITHQRKPLDRFTTIIRINNSNTPQACNDTYPTSNSWLQFSALSTGSKVSQALASYELKFISRVLILTSGFENQLNLFL